MTTCAPTDTFRLDPTSPSITVRNSFSDVCKATKILDNLHKDFTEKYVSTATTGRTVISEGLKHKPSFHLRDQPIFTFENISPKNRFYTIFTTKREGDASYNGLVSAILKGEYDTNDGITYKENPNSITNLTDFNNQDSFKGIYGLHKLNELLEKKITNKIDSINVPGESDNVNVSDFNKYQKRQGIKMTLEEIAHRENQIYREKFLNIILILVGIFIISTQLVGKYFSFGDGSSGSFGSGGVSGWFSTRFGSGSGGLFSRFGGLGLGSSGRSRIGNLFTSSPYSLSRR
jgi:hypothetical protein